MRLDGIQILDLTRLLPGPFATQLLSDLGADVVKIEDTGRGDYARSIPPMTNRDTGAVFDQVNRGKRSVAIDLKSDRGTEVFYDLVAEADVVFEQFRPGVVERLDIDYETLKEHNDGLIYCSLTGYGQTGPLADEAGHDINYVGVAGLLDMTRKDENTLPQIPGYLVGDLGGGLFSAFSVVGALLSRELGNDSGEYIDVSMTDVVAAFSQSVAFDALHGNNPRPGATPFTGQDPWYAVYECANGGYLTLAAFEKKFWKIFCEDVGREDLVDAHMTDDPIERAALRDELEAIFAEQTRDEWTNQLSEETATAPVLTPEEALEHPQIASRVVRHPDDAPPRLGFPAVGSHIPESGDESVPDHGEHTDDVLQAAGLDENTVTTLREDGVLR